MADEPADARDVSARMKFQVSAAEAALIRKLYWHGCNRALLQANQAPLHRIANRDAEPLARFLLVLFRSVLFFDHHVSELFRIKNFSAEFAFHKLCVLLAGDDAHARMFTGRTHGGWQGGCQNLSDEKIVLAAPAKSNGILQFCSDIDLRSATPETGAYTGYGTEPVRDLPCCD